MFFKKVTMKAYDQLSSNFLLGMTLEDWPKLTCQKFTQWEDFSNKKGKTFFLDLTLSDIVKSLSSAFLVFILSKQEPRLKFQDKKDHWSPAKISIYIWLL